jgi:hypothetical protein
MLGLSESPKYLLPPGEVSTEFIVEHWHKRWLFGRSSRPEILERLSAQSFENFRLGREVAELLLTVRISF